MTPQEIFSKIQAKCPAAEWKEAAAGDSYALIPAASLLSVASFLKEDAALSFDFLRLLTAVDWRGERFGVVYHLYSYTHGHGIVLHVDLPKDDPRIASVVSLWPTADWLEREAFDMMGVVFEGHPYLKRILLPLDWEGYPLRKDYKDPEEYHGIKHG